MNEELTGVIYFAILFPTLLSLGGSILIFLINYLYSENQPILAKFVLGIALSDFFYAFLGIFMTFQENYRQCPAVLILLRTYSRVMGFGWGLGFFRTLRSLASPLPEVDLESIREISRWIIVVPAVWIFIFICFFPHEYMDMVCLHNNAEITYISNYFKIIFGFPMLLTIGMTIYWLITIIKLLKVKIEPEESTKTKELFIYPCCIFICYSVYICDKWNDQSQLLKALDIFFQQLQGFMDFLIFGLSYDSRRRLKKLYLATANGIQAWFDKRNIDKDNNNTIEMQISLLNERENRERIG